MIAGLASRIPRMIGALSAGALLLGCTSEAEVDHFATDASIYQEVITDLIDRSGPPTADGDRLPVLFIETLAADVIALETQVEVIADFTDVYEVRFIDDMDEAVEMELEGQPVRPNSMLIGLGPILLNSSTEVRGEVYLHADDIRAYRYSFASTADDEWRMLGAPEETEPEGFLPSP